MGFDKRDGSVTDQLSRLEQRWVSGLLFMVTSILSTQAQNTLPTTVRLYGSAYEGNDFGVSPSGCNDNNVLTSSCSCPGGLGVTSQLRVINDANGPNTRTGGHVFTCGAANAEYAGAFEQDDPVAEGQGCRQPNPLTGACSCPAGTTAVSTRTLVDTSSLPLVGSHITFCMRPAPKPLAFGGVFQRDDPVSGGLGCRAANPFTAGCSCPAGFLIQPLRVQVDSSAGYIGSTVFTCAAGVAQREICSGVYADPTGATPAAAALNACLAGGNKTVELPAGTYQVDQPLSLASSTTLRTLGTFASSVSCLQGQACAQLLASANFSGPNGFITADNVNAVQIDHIIVDGNRSARAINSSRNYQACASGSNQYGVNARFTQCSACRFTRSASVGALCGSSLEWFGDDAVIQNNSFVGNGDHYTNNLWSDGLTLNQSNRAVVTGNLVQDNSDVSLIFGGGVNANISGNTIRQTVMGAFAGLMLDNFDGTTSGDFTGTTVSGNTVQCDKCFFGIGLGPHPWYLSANIRGGTVSNNYVRGGVITLNVDGGGTAAEPITVLNNDLGPYFYSPRASGYCGFYARFNVSPDSYVTGTAPDVRGDTDICHQ
jgi:hypothetical protein